MSAEPLRLGNCVVDIGARRVTRGDTVARLTQQEAVLLEHLAERPGETVDRETLFQEVLGYSAGANSRALDAAMRRLRHKVEADPTQPAHVLTVYGVGYRLVGATASALEEAPPPTTSLPRWSGALMGRAPLQRTLVHAVDEHPCVTLHGPAGVGKSRLACSIVEESCGQEDIALVGFVSMRPGMDATSIAEELCTQLHTDPSSDPITSVGLALASRSSMVLLDGTEVALSDVAVFVGELNSLSPDTRVVITSREPLGIVGEHVVRITPLGPTDATALLRSRAAAARGGEPWSADDDSVLASIAATLDHLPLALELAASSAPVMTATQLHERLQHDHRVLRRRSTVGPGHQVTLSAALERSWERLTVPEKQALVELSTLQGPFTIDVAEGVMAPDSDAFALVQTLVAKSLLQAADAQGRIRMLNGLRVFVSQRAGPEAQPAISAALARLAGSAHRLPLAWMDCLRGAEQALEERLPNAVHAVQAALEVCPDARDRVALAERACACLSGDDVLLIGVAACDTMLKKGTADQLDRWLDLLTSGTPSDSDLACDVHLAAGRLLRVRGRIPEALERLEHAVRLCPPDKEVTVLNQLATTLLRHGEHDRPQQLCERVLRQAVRGSSAWARATRSMGVVARVRDRDLERAEAYALDAHRAYRALNDDSAATVLADDLIPLRTVQERFADARALAQEAYQLASQTGNSSLVLGAMFHDAILAFITGEWDTSMAQFEKATQLAGRIGRGHVGTLCSVYTAWLHSEANGNPGGALRQLDVISKEVEPRGIRLATLFTHKVRASVAHRAGDESAMRESLCRAIGALSEEDTPTRIADAHAVRAHLLASADPDAAAESLAIASEQVKRAGGPNRALGARWAISASWVAHEAGRVADAHRHIQDAESLLRETELTEQAHLWRMLQELRQALDTAGPMEP